MRNYLKSKKKRYRNPANVGVINIKNSKDKSIKTKKSGRLGKNCKNFNAEKQSCLLTGVFCKSDFCPYYAKKEEKQ